MEDRTGDRNTETALETIEMSQELSQYHGSADEILVRYSHCSLCGGNLHFNYLTDFRNNLAFETASCPECSIKLRRVMHKLQ